MEENIKKAAEILQSTMNHIGDTIPFTPAQPILNSLAVVLALIDENDENKETVKKMLKDDEKKKKKKAKNKKNKKVDKKK